MRRLILVFPEGRGLLGGWETLANKVRFLGVGCSVISAWGGGGGGENKSLAPARREEKPLYVEAAKVHFGRARDAMWLQLRETDSLECLKAHSLVGKWLGWENTFEDWDNFRRWGVWEWGLRGASESVVVVWRDVSVGFRL